jgi:hypothetical protein
LEGKEDPKASGALVNAEAVAGTVGAGAATVVDVGLGPEELDGPEEDTGCTEGE